LLLYSCSRHTMTSSCFYNHTVQSTATDHKKFFQVIQYLVFALNKLQQCFKKRTKFLLNMYIGNAFLFLDKRFKFIIKGKKINGFMRTPKRHLNHFLNIRAEFVQRNFFKTPVHGIKREINVFHFIAEHVGPGGNTS